MKKRYALLFIASLIASALTAQWTPLGISDSLQNQTIESIEGVVYHNGKLYANTFLNGMMVSNDLGDSWDSLQAVGINHYVVEMKSYRGRLHAFCHINGLVAGMYYHSDDDGLTWTLDTAGMPESAITAGYPANFINVEFVGDYMLAQMGTPLQPYYRKHIDSTTWHRIPLFDNQGATTWYVKNDTVWTYNIFNIWYSIDDGKSWVQTPHNIPSFAPRAMAKEGGTIYLIGAGGWGNPGKLMKSTDNGATWNQMTQISTLIDTSWLNQPADILTMHVSGDEIYLCSTNDATNTVFNVWYSSDGGNTFAPDTAGFHVDPHGTTAVESWFEAEGYLFAVVNFKDVYRKGVSIGIPEVQSAVQAFPTPANEWIETPEMEVGTPYVVVGLNGSVYQEGELQASHRISTSELQDGIYVISFQTGTSVTSLKVVVSH